MRGRILRLTGMTLAAWAIVAPMAFAQAKYNIKEMTPAVEAALEGRRSRYDQLTALKSEGRVGENNRGYVQTLLEDSEVDSLVEAENLDRKVIYQTIAEQNGLTDALETIENVFAQVQRDKANAGDMIQLEDGSWVKK